MEIKITNWKTHGSAIGYIASFDANLDCGLDVRGLALLRREENPDDVWLVIPSIERDKRQTVGMSRDVRRAIGERAAMMYNASTGVSLTFVAPPGKGAVVVEEEPARPRVIKSTWMRTDESHDAGLRRAIGAGVEEALAIAGL